MAVNKTGAVRISPPGKMLCGRVTLPGSKSITNRALLLAALAQGTSRLDNALESDDTRYMAQALRQMGALIEQPATTRFEITGNGCLTTPSEPLFLGNAGTATRFLTAAAATVDGTVVIDGDAHMRKRPIGPLIDALQKLGVDAKDTDGSPPVTIRGRGGFKTNVIEIDGALSSQYVSAIMMAAPLGSSALEITVPGPDIGARGYIDVTAAVMRAFGASVEQTGPSVWRIAATGYKATRHIIEPDASAATYLWAVERLTGGTIDLGADPAAMSQPDARAHAIIKQFPDLPAQIDGSQIQDAVPTLAVLAAFNNCPVRFTGIANLRVKECDRTRALSTELNKIQGGLAEEKGDDLIIHAERSLAGRRKDIRLDSHADHRIAMSLALAGLLIDGITIADPACVAKTYPRFWDDLASLGAGLAFGE